MRIFFAVLMLFHAIPAIAGWTGRVSPENSLSPGRVSIGFSPQKDQGDPTFKDALAKLAREGHVRRLELIWLYGPDLDPAFEKEVLSALQQLAPKELAEAQRSAGNIHNPKMVQLRKPFADAVLVTPTVKNIDSNLSKYGLHVSGAIMEKFMLSGDKDHRKFMCLLWLEVSQSKINEI